jgi:hypothetical protein
MQHFVAIIMISNSLNWMESFSQNFFYSRNGDSRMRMMFLLLLRINKRLAQEFDPHELQKNLLVCVSKSSLNRYKVKNIMAWTCHDKLFHMHAFLSFSII